MNFTIQEDNASQQVDVENFSTSNDDIIEGLRRKIAKVEKVLANKKGNKEDKDCLVKLKKKRKEYIQTQLAYHLTESFGTPNDIIDGTKEDSFKTLSTTSQSDFDERSDFSKASDDTEYEFSESTDQKPSGPFSEKASPGSSPGSGSSNRLRAYSRPDAFDSPQPETPKQRSWRPKRVIDVGDASNKDEDPTEVVDTIFSPGSSGSFSQLRAYDRPDVFDSPTETPMQRSWRPKRVIDIKPSSLDDDDVPDKEEQSPGVEHGETGKQSSNSFSPLRAYDRPDVFDSPIPETPRQRSWRAKRVINIKPASLDDDDDDVPDKEKQSPGVEHGEYDEQGLNSFISQQSVASSLCTFHSPAPEKQEEGGWRPWCKGVIKVDPAILDK
jgi:hypothetical protein